MALLTVMGLLYYCWVEITLVNVGIMLILKQSVQVCATAKLAQDICDQAVEFSALQKSFCYICLQKHYISPVFPCSQTASVTVYTFFTKLYTAHKR